MMSSQYSSAAGRYHLLQRHTDAGCVGVGCAVWQSVGEAVVVVVVVVVGFEVVGFEVVGVCPMILTHT